MKSLVKTLSPLGLWISTVKLAGEIRGIRLIVAGACDPELEPHRRAGTIDRPVGDRVDLHLVIGRSLARRRVQMLVKPR